MTAAASQTNITHLPDALAPLITQRRWVIWRWERTNKGKPTKVPYQAAWPDRKAKSTDPKTWSNYDTAVNAAKHADGVGFCLLDSDIAAFDIDKCRDPKTGVIDEWASALVGRVGSYTEITVSGTGLRIVGRGVGAKVHRKLSVAGDVSCEMYRRAERYIVVTGNALPGTAPVLTDIDEQIDATLAELDGKKSSNGAADQGDIVTLKPDRRDDDLEEMIRDGCSDRYGGDRSRALWRVIHLAINAGWTDEAITAALLNRANKISSHVYDQEHPADYLRRQITRARQISAEDFARNGQGAVIRNSQKNIGRALDKLGANLRHDVFQDRLLIDGIEDVGPLLDDRAISRLWLAIDERFGFRPEREFFLTVITDAARRTPFHPVLDYLDGLRWDGKRRLNTWLSRYAGAKHTRYVSAVGRLMLVAAVRRVRHPGCKFDELVVLESAQGTNKSSALQLLAVNDDWFSDDMPLGADGKRVIEALAGRWIVEAAELKGMKRGDIESLKAFLSRPFDRARMSYDRLITEVRRQCVIVGTTNSAVYLRDGTGNRRFWPVTIERFNLDALRRDRDQLWAEAVAREAAGESIRLDRALWEAAAIEQRARTVEEPYVAIIDGVLEDLEGKVRAEDIWAVLSLQGGNRTQDHNARLGDAMKELGFTAMRRRFGGAKEYGYERGDTSLRITITRNDDGSFQASNTDPGAIPRPTLQSSATVTRHLFINTETEKAVLVSGNGVLGERWLPKSKIQMMPQADDGSVEIRIPLWLWNDRDRPNGESDNDPPF
jgi:Virulence-associated protein E